MIQTYHISLRTVIIVLQWSKLISGREQSGSHQGRRSFLCGSMLDMKSCLGPKEMIWGPSRKGPHYVSTFLIHIYFHRPSSAFGLCLPLDPWGQKFCNLTNWPGSIVPWSFRQVSCQCFECSSTTNGSRLEVHLHMYLLNSMPDFH